MKRKVIGIIFAIFCAVNIIGCRFDNTETIKIKSFSSVKMVNISDGVWYDQKTKIVYFWNGCLQYSNCTTTPSPYYGSNGKPCVYDVSSGEIRELE